MNADNNAIISFNDPTLSERYSQEEIERQRQNYEAGKGAFTKTDKMVDSVVFTVLHNYDFVRVLDRGELGTIYFKPSGDKTLTYQELKPVLLERIITDTMQASYHSAPSQKVKAAMETLKVSVKDSISTVSNDLIELADGYYWDTISASLKEAKDVNKYEYYDGKRYCFRRLFDSEGTSEIKIDTSYITPQVTLSIMKSVLKHLEETEGDLYPDDLTGDCISSVTPLTTKDLPLAPFWTWANEDVETFNDLLKAVATNFMEHKPKGSFVLIGLKRNGKSTFVKLLHTLFGRNNTSAVRLADFNNHGLNGELWTTMMNAPDEEDEATGNDILSVQTNFKSIAAHESLKLRKLYAQQGQSVNTDFMCFFPMNHFPEWKGSGAAACMQRTLPIFFDNDLSKYDNNGKDFVRETYTASFFQELLGVVLAFAAYYHDRPLRFSDKMMSDQRRVSTTVDNVNTFVAQFMSYFRGYSKKGLVYQEYRNWCIERDLEPQSKAVLSTALELRDEKSRIFYENENDRYGERVTEIVHDDPSKPYFRMNQTIPELQHKTVESFLMGEKDQYGHYKNSEVRSVINALENLREKRLSEERINRSKGGE